jgi:hypothetical protein
MPYLFRPIDDCVLRLRVRNSRRPWVEMSLCSSSPARRYLADLGLPPEGAESFEVEAQLLTGATVQREGQRVTGIDTSTAELAWRGVIGSARVVGSADDMLTPVRSAQADRDIERSLRPRLSLSSEGAVQLSMSLRGWHIGDSGEDWAYRYDDAAALLMCERPADIADLANHPDHSAAVPTPDHFLPLLYIAGIAATSGAGAVPLVRGCTLGSISMSCYGVGIEGIDCATGGAAAAVPADVPADQTNL